MHSPSNIACVVLRHDSVNVFTGPKEDRILITGLHTVVDIYCIDCHTVLGWKYVRDSRLLEAWRSAWWLASIEAHRSIVHWARRSFDHRRRRHSSHRRSTRSASTFSRRPSSIVSLASSIDRSIDLVRLVVVVGSWAG